MRVGPQLPLIAVLLLGCAKPGTQVVLMPDPQGHVGRVEVRNEQGTQTLDQARQCVEIPGPKKAPGAPETLTDGQILAGFGRAMEAQPKPPAHFLLQFESGTVTLTETSKPIIGRILKTIRERHPLDISVVGHTDTAGSDELNNQLARQRAAVVAKLLLAAGVDPQTLEITSHGKAVPLVPTGDNVPEPRNRRVEVTVR